MTFEDISDPTSIRWVDPTDLAASFGEGYALKEVTFGITRDPVTKREVGKVLEWLGSYEEWITIPASGVYKETTKHSFQLDTQWNK